ncbi:L-threonylcarbamoyladenylate synthase [Haematococcus lacustris]|uniref:Threonylcarbamoyl-AMP synthase n=1 Tax=Haematococcus lacustris TaxID=44745 RepID=A0A699ZZ30_HAELA|nr:L-threonylcarbamoyladenylate synthase [Haematococcus lacustris]
MPSFPSLAVNGGQHHPIFSTECLVVDPDSPELAAIVQAGVQPHQASQDSPGAALLLADQVVALPTETVYGLAANALSAAAVARIYTAKQRPADNPLIVHVADMGMLSALYPQGWKLPSSYQAAVQAHWPGPLTILLPRSPQAADIAAATNGGAGSAGAHLSEDPECMARPRDECAAALQPLLAPLPAQPECLVVNPDSPELAAIVQAGVQPHQASQDSPGAALLLADQVVALPTETVYGLAANALSAAAVARIYTAKQRPADNPLIVHVADMGMLSALYPPGWKLPSSYQAAVQAHWPGPLTILLPRSPQAEPGCGEAGCGPVASGASEVEVVEYCLGDIAQPAVVAQHLFLALRRMDEEGVREVLVEGVQEGDEGLAVMNRLRKAATRVEAVRAVKERFCKVVEQPGRLVLGTSSPPPVSAPASLEPAAWQAGAGADVVS